MIQDISPYRLDMAYRGTAPAPDDCFFSFRGEDVLLRDMGDGSFLILDNSFCKAWWIYLKKKVIIFYVSKEYF